MAPSQWGLWELGTWGRQEEGRAWEAPWTWSWRAKVSATLCEGCWEECLAWPAHRTSGRKLSGARPAQGPGGTVQQEPLGQTWRAELLSCLSVLLLLFKVKSWGKCPARACNRFVPVVCGVCAYILRGMSSTACVACGVCTEFACVACGACTAFACVCVRLGDCRGDSIRAERVGRQGLPCGWWRWAGCGRRWGGEAGSRHWMWGFGGGAWISLSQTAALSSSAVVPQGPHQDSGQATPMAQPGLTCQCGNLSAQNCGPRLGRSQGESTREASLIALAPPPTTCGSGQGVPICERHVQPSCCLGAGKMLLRRDPGIHSNRPGCPTPHLAHLG